VCMAILGVNKASLCRPAVKIGSEKQDVAEKATPGSA
jgi:hypothetical protein